MRGFFRKSRALFFVAGRPEYFLADLLPFASGVLIGWATLRIDVVTFWKTNYEFILLGLAATILAHFATVWANDLGDYELDKDKSHLPQAVDIIGKHVLLYITITTIAINTFIILYMCVMKQNYIYLSLWAIGIITTLSYSCPPARLKKYLYLNEITRGLPLVILLPFGYFLVQQKIELPIVLYTIGLAINLLGLFLVGEVWCYVDDIGQIHTIATVFGYIRSLSLSRPIMLAGIFFMWTGYFLLAYTLGQVDILSISYLIFWIVCIVVIFFLFNYHIYQQRKEYVSIYNKCGFFTKAGTSMIWFLMAISPIFIIF